MNFNDIKTDEAKYYLQVFSRLDVCFVKGSGDTLYDTNGRQYTDLFSGIAVTSLGHSHPAVAEAIINSANSLLHTSNLYYSAPQTELARLIVTNSCADRVFFGNSGAEANEGAFKLARKYFYKQNANRYEIISAKNSFHGRTLATVAATGQEKYQKPYRPLTPGFINVEFGSVEAIKAALSARTAAVLLETIQGEGGVVPGGAEYLRAVAALCKNEGILLILDDVQMGMGRTGKLFSYEHYGIEPDIFTLAKALANGVPIGSIALKQHVADAIEPGDHGSTFGGNPLACSAGVAVMNEMLSKKLPERAAEIGARAIEGLRTIKHKAIKEIRGLGLIIGIELDEAFPASDVAAKCLEAGYVVGTAARNTLRLAPPLIIGEDKLKGFSFALENEILRGM